MIKLLHFADIHFGMENYGLTDPKTGLNSRLLDWQKSYQELVDYALNQQIDAVLFSGDAFKTRDPSPTYQNAFFAGLKKMADAQIPIIVIPGNHDLPLALNKKSALETLVTLKVPQVYFSKKIALLKIPVKNTVLQIISVPFVYKTNLCQPEELKGKDPRKLNQILTQKLEEQISYQASLMRRDQPRILMAHLSIENAVLGSEQMVGLGQDLLLSTSFLKRIGLDYVALGHLHKYQIVLNQPLTIYPGSLERIDFSEEKEEKGFVVVKFIPRQNKQWRAESDFVPVQARKFLTVRVNIPAQADQPQKLVLDALKKAKIKNTVLRIIIRAKDEQVAKISEIALRQAAEKAFTLGPIIKKTDELDTSAEQTRLNEQLFAKTPSQNVIDFIQTLNVSDQQKTKLDRLARQIMQEVDEGGE